MHMKKYDESALCLAQSKDEGLLCVGGADGLIKIMQQEHWLIILINCFTTCDARNA